jgi:hypothetical protein
MGLTAVRIAGAGHLKGLCLLRPAGEGLDEELRRINQNHPLLQRIGKEDEEGGIPGDFLKVDPRNIPEMKSSAHDQTVAPM